jgi:SAM-dependent methyltransferase
MSASVEEHYTKDGLAEAVRAALAAAGKDLAVVTVEDLTMLDQLHVGGVEATRALAGALPLGPEARVLDVGCGIGGPSRMLAAEFGCRVTGVDLTAAFCRLAEELADWVGLADRVSYRAADALDLPFEAGAFDVAWTQHAAMNIADKAGLYRELRRVLRPGGHLALYDILAGDGGAPFYPVPWARDPAISHLVDPESLRALLEAAGFEVVSWRDRTAEGLDWHRARSQAMADGAPPAGPRIFIGEDFAEILGNLRRNLEDGRVRILEAVCRAV